MTRPAQPTVDRRPGQSYWERLREVDAILAARSAVTPAKREQIAAFLRTSPYSAAPPKR